MNTNITEQNENHTKNGNTQNEASGFLPPLPKIEKFTDEELEEFEAVFEGGDYPF